MQTPLIPKNGPSENFETCERMLLSGNEISRSLAAIELGASDYDNLEGTLLLLRALEIEECLQVRVDIVRSLYQHQNRTHSAELETLLRKLLTHHAELVRETARKFLKVQLEIN